MIIDAIRDLMTKGNIKENTGKKPAYIRVPEEVYKVFKEAAALLRLDGIDIKIVPYIFNSFTIWALGFSDERIPEVPLHEYCKGYYSEKDNTIYLAKYAPVSQDQDIDIGNKGLIETMLHEIRHIWQKEYHKDTYFSSDNAISIEEHLCDISEVDADSFALVYMLCVLGYENTDISFDMMFMYSNDNGARKERTVQIMDDYGLSIKM